MCYTSASAARNTAKQALANGTLILLVPPMVFFALITVVLYRYRNKFREMPEIRESRERLSGESPEPGEHLSHLFDRPIIAPPDLPIHPRGQRYLK